MKRRTTIHLCPYGVPGDRSRELAEAADDVVAGLGCTVALAPPFDVGLNLEPPYNARELLHALRQLRPSGPVLLLVDNPLIGDRHRPVRGASERGGTVGVVHIEGAADDVAAVAHEVGHLMGLAHCGYPGCLMGRRPSHDRKGACDHCVALMDAVGDSFL
ncbi:MAG: hypothetical protein GF320_16150 [Armatimonadia bacterium]|nr:hypothetical protein [Armatimonadia bacterium]